MIQIALKKQWSWHETLDKVYFLDSTILTWVGSKSLLTSYGKDCFIACKTCAENNIEDKDQNIYNVHFIHVYQC